MKRVALALAVGVLIAAVALGRSLLPERLVPPERRDLVITGVTVLNPGEGRTPDQTLEVRDGRIAAIRPRRDGDPPPICPDCFALPGLIDAHVHTPPRIALGNQALFALLYLLYGVTTVRDLGASDDSVADLAAALNAGHRVGPRMLRCGPVLDGDPPGWPMATKVTDREAARRIVAELAREGVDCIKVYNEIRPAVFEALAAAARAHGLPLIGHVPHAVGLDHVRDFEAQHFTGIPYLTRPRPGLGWDIADEDLLAMSDAEIDAALDIAAVRSVSFTPTLANFGLRLIASDRRRFPPTPGASLLPAFWAEAWNFVAGHPESEAAIQSKLAAAAPLRRIAARARARGIDVLAGTDTIMPWVVPGESLHLELAALADAFGSAEAALASATRINGRHLGAGSLGVLAPGARADILLLPADPTADLTALRDWSVLVADGRRYDRAQIDAFVAAYRRHFEGRAYAAVMNGAMAIAARSYGSTASAEPAQVAER